MKKTLSLLLLSACFALTAQAQLPRGYYRIQNTYTNRYISLSDNNPANYPISASNITMPGIRTIAPGEAVNTNPATIYLIYNMGGTQYDMEAQGASIHFITGGRMYINLAVQSDGSYQAYGTYSGITAWLADDSELDVQESYLKNRSDKTRNWWARPVDTANEYLGIKPDVEVGGKYYGTIYASFPFKLVSAGMKAYVVTQAAGSGFQMEEITGTIPGMTPVIIECSSNSPADNKILPVEEDAALGKTNLLYGALCARVSSRYWNVIAYDATTMRTIGKSDGKLAFVKASGSDLVENLYLKANKAYLTVPGNASSTLVLGGSTEPQPEPQPQPEVQQFSTMGSTYTINSDNTATLTKVDDTLDGPYEIPGAATNSNNGQNYVISAIGEKAFQNQAAMTGVAIPSSVTSIGRKAFDGCTGLIAVYTFATNPPALGELVFNGVDKENCIIHIPDNTETAYTSAEGWKEFVNIWTTGIRDVKYATTTNDRWYSLDGRELKAQPVKKGIYIHNGKKVVVK